MAKFRSVAVQRLTYEFPATLAEFDDMNGYSRIEECPSLTEELFTAIALAHKYSLRRILPWAFLAACELLTPEEILRPMGVTQTALSPEDQRICITGWRRLMNKQIPTTFAGLIVGNKACTRSSCKTSREQTLIKEFVVLKDRSGTVTSIGLDGTMTPAVWEKQWENGLCKACIKVAQNLHEEGRQRMWDDLPSIFGLPGWVELLEEEWYAALPLQFAPGC